MAELQTNQFKDTANNIWSVSVTVGSYMRIKNEMAIDIIDLTGEDGGWLTKTIAEENMYEMLSVLATLIEAQLERRGMELEDWYELMDGDCLEAAGYALLGGVINFIPAHKRGPLSKISELVQTKKQKTSELLEKHIAGMSEELNEMIETKLGEEMNALRSSYSKQQESSE